MLWKNKRKVPFHTTLKLVLTVEEIEKMSVQEIYDVILKEFEYDDYKYQLDNNILITEKNRAEKIHKILYKCPHCLSEGNMDSEGTTFYCKECGNKL